MAARNALALSTFLFATAAAAQTLGEGGSVV